MYRKRSVYSGTSLLADLKFQKVSGEYENFARMAPADSELLINLVGPENCEKGYWISSSYFISRQFGSNIEIFGHRLLVDQSAISIQNF